MTALGGVSRLSSHADRRPYARGRVRARGETETPTQREEAMHMDLG